MHIIFQEGVDNFEIEHKTCKLLVRGAEPLNIMGNLALCHVLRDPGGKIY